MNFRLRIVLVFFAILYSGSRAFSQETGKAQQIGQYLQTSGLSDIGFPELAFNEQPKNLDQSIARLNGAKLADGPGEKFQYHNPNYQILAKIVEAVGHKPFGTYLDENIFQPLRMKHTSNVALTESFGKTSKDFQNVIGQRQSEDYANCTRQFPYGMGWV